MRIMPLIWATALVASSVLLAFLSFYALDAVVEGVLLYIGQCLLFAASVAGNPYVVNLKNLKNNDKSNKNNPGDN